MARLSAIGLETTHGFIYPAMINGYDPDALRAHSLDIVWNIFPTGGAPSVESETRIVACYDPDPALARKVAEACRIDRVCQTLEEAYEDVDGVAILSGDSAIHRAQATPALRAGLPTFVDKPFTATVEDALALIELSKQYNAPLFCTSAVRFAEQTVALRERLGKTIGAPLAAHVIGNGDYDIYAVHSIELLLSVWGGGVSRLESIGQLGFDTIALDYPDGRRAIWQVCRDIVWGFYINLFGPDGVDGAGIPQADRYAVFRNTAAEIVKFMESGVSPVPLSETLEIVRLLELGAANRGAGPIDLTPLHI